MIQLKQRDYPVLLQPLKAIECNTLFVRAVLAGCVDGKVFADTANNPASFYVYHPYGMSLLFGDVNARFFDAVLGASAEPREKDEWLQAYPGGWDKLFYKIVADGRAVPYQRVNFTFDKAAYHENKPPALPAGCTVVPTSEDLFYRIDGAVVPKAFWREGRQFADISAGFTVLAGANPLPRPLAPARRTAGWSSASKPQKNTAAAGWPISPARRLLTTALKTLWNRYGPAAPATRARRSSQENSDSAKAGACRFIISRSDTSRRYAYTSVGRRAGTDQIKNAVNGVFLFYKAPLYGILAGFPRTDLKNSDISAAHSSPKRPPTTCGECPNRSINKLRTLPHAPEISSRAP